MEILQKMSLYLSPLFDVYLLVPKEIYRSIWFNVKYIESAWWYKFFPMPFAQNDSWHAIHQRSHFPHFGKTQNTNHS